MHLLPKHCNQGVFRNPCSYSVFVHVGLFAGVCVCVCVYVCVWCLPASLTISHQAVCCQAVLYIGEPFDQSQGIECVSVARWMATSPLPRSQFTLIEAPVKHKPESSTVPHTQRSYLQHLSLPHRNGIRLTATGQQSRSVTNAHTQRSGCTHTCTDTLVIKYILQTNEYTH